MSAGDLCFDRFRLGKSRRGKTIAGRRGWSKKLSGLALFLASDASSFVTGASFVIDGGQLVGNALFP